MKNTGYNITSVTAKELVDNITESWKIDPSNIHKMENKYYTPDLNEFHIGFEYEEFELRESIQNWYSRTCEASDFDFLNRIYNYENLKSVVRVKCLDKSDIESLGWKHDFNDDGEEYPNMQSEHGYSLGFSIDHQLTESKTAYLLHYFPDQYMIIDSIVACGSGRENMLFRGYVKNKFELSKLMKHLCIKP